MAASGGARRGKSGGMAAVAAKETESERIAREAGVVLPEGVTLSVAEDGSRSYDSNIDGNNLTFVAENYGDSFVISFSVNSSYDKQNLPASTGSAIAAKVNSIMRADIASRPNGFAYSTSSWTGDALGSSRTALYARAGFSIPKSRGEAEQLGVVRGGKLTPAIRVRGEIRPLNASEQKQQRDKLRELLRQARTDRRS